MATFEEWWQSTNLGIHSTSESIGKSSWNAGAASRDAEVAELRELSPCGKHSIIHWARPMRAEPFCTVCAEIAELRAQLERATDLVRYARHFLHEEELISDDEYAAIVQDNEDGKRVARLEGYDRAAGAASRDEEVAELRSKIEAARVLIQRWRDMTNAEEYKLHREWAIDQNADDLEAALGKPTNPVTDKPREPINWHIIDACQACSEHYGICEHHQKLYGESALGKQGEGE